MSEAYEWTPEMGEISGFGGGYEDACRRMVRAGLEWFDEHPDAEPKFHGWEGVYGIAIEDNDDAKALTAAVLTGCPDGPTGAMHQATITTVLWIHEHGWSAYVENMSRNDKEG